MDDVVMRIPYLMGSKIRKSCTKWCSHLVHISFSMRNLRVTDVNIRNWQSDRKMCHSAKDGELTIFSVARISNTKIRKLSTVQVGLVSVDGISKIRKSCIKWCSYLGTVCIFSFVRSRQSPHSRRIKPITNSI